MPRPIYVGLTIASDVDAVWRRTQDPAHHERWDLRFSAIEYLPRDSGEPQRFRYSTRLGLGIHIAGWGESVASRQGPNSGISSLRFGSDAPLSLIHEGSGYWKYTERDGLTEFETGYDYEPRWSWAGRLVDSLVFRPMIGWATAWSFDRLRLWIERGTDPSLSFVRAVGHTSARLSLVAVFAYHGLVPKLITRNPEELDLLIRTGAPAPIAPALLTAAGIAELLFSVVLLVLWQARWMYALSAAVLFVLPATALVARPDLVSDPFSPISLSIALIALCLVGWVCCVDLPSASRCRRQKNRATYQTK